MKKTIRNQMFRKIFLYMCIIPVILSLILFNYEMIRLRKNCEKTSQSVARFVNTEIDADDAKRYITSRKTDDKYYQTQNNLIKYVGSGDIVERISVVNCTASVGYYIYDTDENVIGTKIKYEDYDYMSSVKDRLTDVSEEWNVIDKNKFYTFSPLITRDNKIAGYTIITLDYSVRKLYIIFLAVSLVLIIVLNYIIGKIYIISMDQTFFKPIDRLSRTALDFTNADSLIRRMDPDELFETNRDDEIGNIGIALKRMAGNLNNSSEILSNAMFEANHDAMTHAFNKRYYENVCGTFSKLSSICIIYFDVNNLKLMNDTEGHDRGDYVITKSAEYIRTFTKENCSCFRMGGDEFLFVMANCSYKEMNSVIERLEKESPYILSADSDSVRCSLSYGYAYAKGSYDYDKLLSTAEENMYKHKTETKKKLHMPER